MRLERSTYPQVEAYLEGNDTVLMLFGSTEQHGKHNPLGTDSFAPQKLSELIEKDLPGLLIAPILPFGSSPRFVEFPGTFNLGDQLYLAVVKKLCENLYDQGFRHFVFLNGHGGNSKALTECQLDLAKKGCRAALLNWWSMVADFNPEWAGGHGGGQETSANLYIDPTMVDLDSVEGMGLINDLSGAARCWRLWPPGWSTSSRRSPRPLCPILRTKGFDTACVRRGREHRQP